MAPGQKLAIAVIGSLFTLGGVVWGFIKIDGGSSLNWYLGISLLATTILATGLAIRNHFLTYTTALLRAEIARLEALSAGSQQ